MFVCLAPSGGETRVLQLRSLGGLISLRHSPVPPGGATSDPTQVTIVIKESRSLFIGAP